MAGDFFNGWPEDGEPVPRLSDDARGAAKVWRTVSDYPGAAGLADALDSFADRLDLLEKALVDIINMKSCLLASAQEIAKEALRETG